MTINLLQIAQRLIEWDVNFPVNGHNGYAGLKELDRIIADAKAAVTNAGATHVDDLGNAPLTPILGGIEEYFERQIGWSRETFGPSLRTKGVLDHIRKELGEIEHKPHDLSEWVDVVILAMDGFWRHGGKAADLLPALLAKQQKNIARTWPDWRGMSEDSAIEHDRSKDKGNGDV
jgi:hypothetical protein